MRPRFRSFVSPCCVPSGTGVSELWASSPVNIILNHRHTHVKGIIEMLKKLVDRIFFLLGWYGCSDLEGMGRAVNIREGAREISRLPSLPPQPISE